jgi:hypothetical protein
VDLEDRHLEAGTYMLLISVPEWNECANQRPEFKEMCVDIFSSQENLNIQPTDGW